MTKKRKKLIEHKTFSRQDILEEHLLRDKIRDVLKESLAQRKTKNCLNEQQTTALKMVIRDLILEAETENAPHESTGINVLETLLKKIIPQIEGDYKALTTDKPQRDSFRAHIITATENSIAPKSATGGKEERAELEDEEEGEELEGEEEPLEEIEISVDKSEDTEEEVDADEITALDDDEKLIDIGDMGGAPDDDSFEQIEGEDDTGRNMANMSFQKIEKSIQDSYALLGSPEDQKLFRDYLLTNLKLYFDKFEDELGAGGETEPTTPEYEEEKGKAKETEDAGGEETEGEGEGEEIGGDEEELELEL
tara:strand:- start:373 stop:1299 length:927 start_codon:yes stop_codon:yes gene_type:complete